MRIRHTVRAAVAALVAFCAVATQAQFDFTTNNGTLSISQYTGFDQVVTIPATTNNLPVTAIGDLAFQGANIAFVSIPSSVTTIGMQAFAYCTSLTNIALPPDLRSISSAAFLNCSTLRQVAIPDTLTNLGSFAFDECSNLTSVALGNGLVQVSSGAFKYCVSLTNVVIGNNVASVSLAFLGCTSLSSITLPASITNLTTQAFASCTNLTSVYFQGNAPTFGANVFTNDDSATIYYVPGTGGWGSSFGGRPTALWYQPNPRVLSGPTFGIHTNAFSFTISWATNIPIIVEASATLANPSWLPVSTNTLVNGTSYFFDARWTNSPARFFRLRSP